MTSPSIGKLRVFIASYAHVKEGELTKLGGPALALSNFLRGRVQKLVCVWQPVLISDTLHAMIRVSHGTKEEQIGEFALLPDRFANSPDFSLPYFLLKIRDVLSVLYAVTRIRGRFDLYVGVESHNALIGVFLRWLGLVDVAVYYVLDYGDVRFRIRWLNRVFHAMDRLAVRCADVTWNLSEWMITTRIKLGLPIERSGLQLVVPIGTEFRQIDRPPLHSVDRSTVAYIGVLSENTGVRLLFDAMPLVLEALPGTHFLIIGTGPLAGELAALAAARGIQARIEFTGVISDGEAARRLSQCAVGVAPYEADPNSIKRFTDVTKPKVYLSCGLPTVITPVPPIASEIAANGAGLVVGAAPFDLARGIIAILNDDGVRATMREQAIRLAQCYDWDTVFKRALVETLSVGAAGPRRGGVEREGER